MITLQAVDRKQAFRYMGMHAEPDENFLTLADKCEKRLLSAISPRYTYRVLPIETTEAGVHCEGSDLFLTGNDAAAHLNNCGRVILLCATLSAGADAAIRAAEAEDVLAGLMTDAMASALTEQLCDAVEKEILADFPEEFPTWRFSPGYGDLPLAVQETFLRTLNAEKRLGVSVSEGGMLIPVKSVSAFIGLSSQPIPKGRRGCAICNLSERCPYRAKGGHCE